MHAMHTMHSPLCLLIAYLLDLILGDPHGFPHPVIAIGKLISGSERVLRRILPATKAGELFGGFLLALFVPSVSYAAVALLLALAYGFHDLLGIIVESFICYQILAIKSLKAESLRVYTELKKGDLPAARQAVSWIVGRDTDALSAEGVAKAAVETVAENTTDAAVAPILFMALGGAPLGMFYKAINTLDSMVGYKNEKYLYFGRISARLDDLANLLPARLAALVMILACFPCRLDAAAAWRIFRRDRYRHGSPNSAHTEAVCAGALGVQLGGDAQYKGVLVSKPRIGDDLRPIEAEDIVRANDLHYRTSGSILIVAVLIKTLFRLLPP